MAEIYVTVRDEEPPCLARNIARLMQGNPRALDNKCVIAVGASSLSLHCMHKALGTCDVAIGFPAPGYMPQKVSITPVQASSLISRCPWLDEWAPELIPKPEDIDKSRKT